MFSWVGIDFIKETDYKKPTQPNSPQGVCGEFGWVGFLLMKRRVGLGGR